MAPRRATAILAGAAANTPIVGREAELQQLANRILDPPTPLPCSVVGETRIGKSSLLKEFERLVEEQQRKDLLCLRYDMSSDFHEMLEEDEQIGKVGTSAFYRNFVTRISADLSDYQEFDHRSAQRASDPQEGSRGTLDRTHLVNPS